MKSQDTAKELEEKMRQAEKEAKELEMKKRLAEEEKEKTRKENLSQKQKTEAMVMNDSWNWLALFFGCLPDVIKCVTVWCCSDYLYVSCTVNTVCSAN